VISHLKTTNHTRLSKCHFLIKIMRPQPIKEGRTKSNSKPFTGQGRQAPPPPKPPKRLTNIEITIK
jgi:hypothetical protein